MSNILKNKWFYVALAMVLGLVIGFIGLIQEGEHGSVWKMVVGALLFFPAVTMLAIGSWGRK